MLPLASAQAILAVHRPRLSVRSLVSLVDDGGYGYTTGKSVYKLLLEHENTTTTAHLTVSEPGPLHTDDVLAPNTLHTIDHLLTLIHEQSSVPLPPRVFDTSCAVVPFHYLIVFESEVPGLDTATVMTLADARRDGLLDPQDEAAVELQLGTYLAQMHAIQNDEFGRPRPSVSPSDEPSYRWEESFTERLEALLQYTEEHGPNLPFAEIRRYLARAIAFFLFDDADVPSLVAFTASDVDIRVSLPAHDDAVAGATVVSFLPNLTYALWADPLLESLFLPPGPSEALLEGYVGAGGANPMVFPRQKTKRLWYTVYLALVVLKEWHGSDNGKVPWATEVLSRSVDALAAEIM